LKNENEERQLTSDIYLCTTAVVKKLKS